MGLGATGEVLDTTVAEEEEASEKDTRESIEDDIMTEEEVEDVIATEEADTAMDDMLGIAFETAAADDEYEVVEEDVGRVAEDDPTIEEAEEAEEVMATEDADEAVDDVLEAMNTDELEDG